MEKIKVKVYGGTREVILPVEGMMGTYYVGSDRYAVVCLKVNNKKCELAICYNITEDNLNKYVHTEDDGGIYMDPDVFKKFKKKLDEDEIMGYSLRKNGIWYRIGSPMSPGCGGVAFGFCQPYMDPSF